MSTEERDHELIDAIVRNDRISVQRLLDQGCNPNTRDSSGTPAIAIACSHREPCIVEALLEAGANARSTIEDGSNFHAAPVLMFPAVNGDTVSLELLLKHGASPNQGDATGMTPLMAAALRGSEGSLRVLLQNDASVTARDNAGYSPIMFAAKGGNAQAIKLLLEAGADVNAIDKGGATALMFAAQHGYTDAVAALIVAGASKWTVESHGLTAADLAMRNGFRGTAEMIRTM